jgi:hypothetical protein
MATAVEVKKQKVTVFSSSGHDVLLEYDPTTADMAEVNRVVDNLEKQFAGRAFSMATGEEVKEVTPETRDVTILRPIAGG